MHNTFQTIYCVYLIRYGIRAYIHSCGIFPILKQFNMNTHWLPVEVNVSLIDLLNYKYCWHSGKSLKCSISHENAMKWGLIWSSCMITWLIRGRQKKNHWNQSWHDCSSISKLISASFSLHSFFFVCKISIESDNLIAFWGLKLTIYDATMPRIHRKRCQIRKNCLFIYLFDAIF